MRCQCWTLLSVFLLGVAVGCGDSSRNSGEANQPAARQAADNANATAAPEAGGPTEAVTQFLEAVRTGNDETATKMFTPLARQKASELDIKVAPRGSDTARFEVGKVEMLGTEGARVATKWSDINPKDGQMRTDEITWMLRRETEGWRVAGMAAVVFPGEPPLLLDFEQPEETMKRLDLLREEVQRRMAKDDSQGQKGQMDQQVQPAEHVRDVGAAQSPSPMPRGETPIQQAAENAVPGNQTVGANATHETASGTREAQRSANPTDPFQR